MCAVDFDTSMHTDQCASVMGKKVNKQLLDYFRALYVRNNPDNYPVTDTVKIPKIIHHIWLGQKLPEEYASYRASWIKHHPSWTFIFWADSPVNFDQGTVVISSFDALTAWLANAQEDRFCVVDVRNLMFENRSFYDQAKNYGEKSDILKWEIVYRMGGVYVDTDFECLRPLDFFNGIYDFYTGIQPLDTNQVQLGAALYGAVPGHPILERCVQDIKHNQNIAQIIVKTGPLHFTRCFLFEANKENNRDIALPASYFYPCGYEQRGMSNAIWQMPESYAVHHWAGSWLKPEGFER
jgi:mannosyltransferase OCH1-like enzyme